MNSKNTNEVKKNCFCFIPSVFFQATLQDEKGGAQIDG